MNTMGSRLAFMGRRPSHRLAGHMIQEKASASDSRELALLARAFAPALMQGDLYELLAYLNSCTAHRFSGVYRFEPGWVVSVTLFDREDPEVRIGANVKMKESYCWLTGLGDSYAIEDATCDGRLDGHAAREAVRSYLAVLLRDKSRAPWGTLCHFDFAPRHADAHAIAQLELFRPLVEEMFVRETRAQWNPDAPSLERAVPLPS